MVITREERIYLRNPTYLLKLRLNVFAFSLSSLDSTNTLKNLKLLYQHNRALNPDDLETLEIIHYLATRDHLIIPAEFNRQVEIIFEVIATYRSLREILKVRDKLADKPKDEALRAKLHLNLLIFSRKDARYEFQNYHPNTQQQALIEKHLNKLNSNSQMLDTTQDYINALRNNDYGKFLKFSKFIEKKYHVYTSLSGTDYLDLALHDFSNTDLNDADVLKLKLLLPLLHEFKLDTNESGFLIHPLSEGMIHLLIAKELDNDLYLRDYQINTLSDLREFRMKLRAVSKHPEFDKRRIEKANKLQQLASRGQEAFREDNNLFLAKAKYGIASDDFIRHVIQNTRLNKVSEKLPTLIPTNDITDFHKSYLSVLITRSNEVIHWQTKLIYKSAIRKRMAEVIAHLQSALPQDIQSYHVFAKSNDVQDPILATLRELHRKEFYNEYGADITDLTTFQLVKSLLADQINQISSDIAETDIFKVRHLEVKKELYYLLIEDIQREIETTKWNVIFSRHTITLEDKKIPVPANIANIYLTCLAAKQPGADIENHYQHIQKTGAKASSRFIFLRNKEAQEFYERFAIALLQS